VCVHVASGDLSRRLCPAVTTLATWTIELVGPRQDHRTSVVRERWLELGLNACVKFGPFDELAVARRRQQCCHQRVGFVDG
jgi:hypothetical protein